MLAKLRSAFPAWAARLGEDHRLDLRLLGQISDTALTQDKAIELQRDGLPNTFVPGRNLMFLNFAGAVAWRRGLQVLVGGMSGSRLRLPLPPASARHVHHRLDLGLDAPMVIETPLMWLDKAATWALADSLGGPPLRDIVIEHTHTCYRGERGTRHAWGHGCGHCPACTLRKTGFERHAAGAIGH